MIAFPTLLTFAPTAVAPIVLPGPAVPFVFERGALAAAGAGFYATAPMRPGRGSGAT